MFGLIRVACLHGWACILCVNTDKKSKAISKQINFCHVNASVIKCILGDPDDRLEVMQCSYPLFWVDFLTFGHLILSMSSCIKYVVCRCPCDGWREGSLFSDVAALQPAPHPRELSKPLLLNPCFEIVQKLIWSLAQFRATLRLPLGQLPGVPSAAVKAEKEPEYHSALVTHPPSGHASYTGSCGAALGQSGAHLSLCAKCFLLTDRHKDLGFKLALFILAAHYSGRIMMLTARDNESSPIFHFIGGFPLLCSHFLPPPLPLTIVDMWILENIASRP